MREEEGKMMLRRGSSLIEGENDWGTMVDKQVIAGWRFVTRGTVSLGLGLYSPRRRAVLSLLTMLLRWYLIDFSW